jgi:hypothetical protein
MPTAKRALGSGVLRSELFLPKKRPLLLRAGTGVKRPALQLPSLTSRQTVRDNLVDFMVELQDRLRRVRVCCGDWERILGPSPTTCIGQTGIFLDPPYSHGAGRDPSLYNCEDLSVAADVREWAIAHGHDPRMRIALCGYAGEHAMPKDWECIEWKANGGYGNQANSRGRSNAFRERIWFSPYCLKPGKRS